jgi:hypothetical protein
MTHEEGLNTTIIHCALDEACGQQKRLHKTYDFKKGAVGN